jgi:hypothetical protein
VGLVDVGTGERPVHVFCDCRDLLLDSNTLTGPIPSDISALTKLL